MSLFIFFSLFPSILPPTVSFVLPHCARQKTFAAFFLRVRFSFSDALRCPLLLVHPFLCLPTCYSFSSSSPIPAHLFVASSFFFVSQNPDFIYSPAVVTSLVPPSNADPLLSPRSSFCGLQAHLPPGGHAAVGEVRKPALRRLSDLPRWTSCLASKGAE